MSGNGGAGSSQTQSSNPAAAAESEAARACLGFVDEYRHERLQMLNEIDLERAPRERDHGHEEEEDGRREPDRPPSRASEPRDVESEEHPRSSAKRRGRHDSDEEGDIERERADPSKYAWAVSGVIQESFLSENLRTTISLLHQYTLDIKRAKRNLLLSVGAPEFPSSEWDNVLRGFAVDLDRVLTGMHSATVDDDEVTELGPYKLTGPKSQPAKKVETTMGTTSLDYSELLLPNFHPRLLEFDRAVRKRVGLRRDLELTSFAAFDDLKIQFIDACGASVNRAGTGGRVKTAARSRARVQASGDDVEACRRWNNGRCPQTSSCRYRHACSKCGNRSHRVAECSSD